MSDLDLEEPLYPAPSAQERLQARLRAMGAQLPADPEADAQDAQRAQMLGQQKSLGILGELSGDRVLAPAGAGLLSRAEQTERANALVPYHRAMAQNGAIRADAAQENADSLGQFRGIPRIKANALGQLETIDPRTAQRVMVDDATRPQRQLTRGGGRGGGAPEAPLTLETAEPWMVAAAKDYASGGGMPSLGNGKEATAAKLKIAKLATLLGNTDGVAAASAGYKAGTRSLANQTKSADMMGAYEDTFLKNADNLEAAAQKIGNLGAPLLNKPLRELESSIGGSPELSAFKTFRISVATEAAKILGGSMGALSDSARQEAEHLIDENATPAQLVASLRALRTEIAGRKKSVDDAITRTRSGLGYHAPAQASAPVAATVHASAHPDAARVRAIAEARLQKNPNDQDALEVLRRLSSAPVPNG